MKIPNRQTPFVGIDCLPLPRHFSGAAKYILHLTRSLLRAPRDFPLAILCRPRHTGLFAAYLKPADKLVTVSVRNRAQFLWRYEFSLPKLLRRQKIHIFHATHYLCPPASPYYKTVSTFHDMGFVRFPYWYSPLKTLYFKRKIPVFLNRADRIVAVSRNTRDDIVNAFPQTAAKIQVLHPGTDHLDMDKIPSTASDPPFILSVNSFEKRKDIAFLLEVFNRLKREYFLPHRLILVGQPGNDGKNILRAQRKSPFASDIDIRISIPDEELIRLYQSADMFVSASNFEGFGFTPFEALRFGLPTFLYRHAVVEELLPRHPYILDHKEPEKWAALIAGAFLKNYSEKFSAFPAVQLTWRNCARQVCELYRSLLNERIPISVSG